MTLSLDSRIVVIGGGFAGASTAYHLSKKGYGKIAVLERETTLGMHASGRNAGLCRQLTEDDETTKYTVPGGRFLARPPGSFASKPLLAQTGSLLISMEKTRLDLMIAKARRWKVPHFALSPEGVVERWPELEFLDELSPSLTLAAPKSSVILSLYSP